MSPDRGMSLIEVMAAVAILAIALSFLLPINEHSRDRGYETRDALLAKLACARRIEEAVQQVEGDGEEDSASDLEWSKDEQEVRVVGDRKVVKITVTVRYELRGRDEPATVSYSTYAVDPKELKQ